ncbi:type I-E CRISPR-associated protein Cse1/CasA [Bifidobacterium ruminantium]|uniref:CRISPR-associated protein, Cse1 family n=1 Tax=Bifidobacterium ruminantium TaxID=78346 RepID=A0A087D3U4_BIFRU|nr:type I-E CRISPR-associated protein Cse1/CasA [Bifidobacterium ruminantium]KFI90194.1 CRISPR-associated protein, Cse1 family [Bifidobacterium ruminantium]
MTDNIFSLLDEPWVQVVYLNGRPDEISLRQVFSDAPDIKELSGDIPQQKLPLIRLFLAILYRAYRVGGINEEQMRELWKEIFSSEHFDMDIVDRYLDKWEDRFFLIGERPFFQIPDLEYVGAKPYSPVSGMIADVPKLNKYLFSMRSMEATDSISFAEAGRWLAFMQAFDTAGIKTPVKGNTHVNKGKVYAPKGMLGTGWLGGIGGLYAEGKNFFETLMLNWVLYDTKYDSERYRLFGNEQDIPVWEQDEVSSSDLDNQSTFAGPVQAMTWQSRRLRLVPNEEGTRIVGVVSCYGDVVAPYNTDGFEKMTAWRKSIPQQKKLGLPAPPHMPVMHDASKALWRGLEPILCVKDDSDFRPGLVRWLEEIRTEMLDSGDHVLNLVTLHAQGMTYGTQSSVFETGIDDTLSLNTVMFRHDYAGIAAVVDAVKCTDNAVQALVQFVRNLRTSAGDKSKSTETAEQIRESVYADLDGLFRDRLAAFDESNDPIEYSNDWKDEVHHRLLEAGQSYLEQSPVPVFDEHEAGVMGVMNAARAQLLFRSKLNKELGSLTREIPVHSDKGGK